MKESKHRLIMFSAETAVISVVVLACVFPVSCRVTEEGLKVLTGDYSPPTVQSYKVTGNSSLEMQFSEAVKIKGSVVTVHTENASANDSDETLPAPSLLAASGTAGAIGAQQAYSEDSTKIMFTFETALNTGTRYDLYGEVEDTNGNTLTFCLPFTGFNSDVPRLIITEIHPMYASGTSGGAKVYKCEFIELFALTGGNLAGLELSSAYDGDEKTFTLPAVKVAAGDVIIVHLRTKGDGCISETGDDLTLSTAKYSSGTARDLWSANEDARLNDSADVIMLKNTADGIILDAVVYAASTDVSWKTDAIKEAAQQACDAGIWTGGVLPSSAVISDGLTASKTIIRSNASALYGEMKNGTLTAAPVPSLASDWSVSATSKETPGTVE